MRAARAAAAVLLLLLDACATLPSQNAATIPWANRLAALQGISRFQLQGRLAASTGTDGFSAGVRWQQQQNLASIDLTAPLGFGAAHIEQTGPQLRVMTSKGVTLENDAASDALAAMLGFAPPVASLRYWILGASDPVTRAQPSLDAQQRLTHLEQGGWKVDYSDYVLVQQQWLPRRITVTRESLRLQLVIDAWQL